MSTPTKERLEQLANKNTICVVSWEERIEMASALLAGLNQEPVADAVEWSHWQTPRKHDVRWRVGNDDYVGPLYAAPQPLTAGERGQVPSPELLCQFVMLNYANYEGAWLCGKSSGILGYLLRMAGHECEKVSCTIGGAGHLYVRCGGLNLDPSIKQFGDYPEISRGAHPCAALGYVEEAAL
ncbi:hypothetical protein [Lelliottia wanjuensis]|uniref:hypothetical protein n=1 Tax=Lelliottia wanjuensis TaxID=3050585 RepID=UPI00254AD4A6|nr:hypothetical protein [Lelliottia sp. V86_10]MDK9585455.1 hypothetical protein [Lelliottia sp. V86_10]